MLPLREFVNIVSVVSHHYLVHMPVRLSKRCSVFLAILVVVRQGMMLSDTYEGDKMTNTEIQAPDGALDTYVAKPEGEGPFPAVCVIHDALGMSQDLRAQADWLASEGYLAAAPDLFRGRTFLACIHRMFLDFMRGEGPLFDRVEATRQWLVNHEQSTGKVGVIGFCFGGGFALMLAPRGGFDVASVNYGTLPSKAQSYLQGACPIVASYGARDRTLKGAAAELETILTEANVDHDIKEYPDTDHAFMNNHADEDVPFAIEVISVLFGGGEYHAESAQDSRQRIIAFFDKYLKQGQSTTTAE
jgi:carboxymethylenebutenolidase